MEAFTCPENSTICSLLNEVGIGIGNVFYYLSQSLPTLLIALAVVAVIAGIFGAVAFVIRSSMIGRR